jgi:hypothetical protein
MGQKEPLMTRLPKSLMLATVLWAAFSQTSAWPLTREEVMERAQSYVDLDWQCRRYNASREYNLLKPGKSYLGVSYNWGGFDLPSQFARKVKSGKVAGNYKKHCGEQLCVRFDFAGLDCSGFVSRCWQIRRYSTLELPIIAIKIPRKLLKPGDILNSRNKHVVLFDSYDDEGQMWAYESSAWVRQQGAPPAGVVFRAVDLGDEYVPRRFYKFIHLGDRIRTERAVRARERFKGGKQWVIPAKTTGTISKGPEFKDKSSPEKTPSDVWYFIQYDNGKQGWSTLRDLILTEEAKSPL